MTRQAMILTVALLGLSACGSEKSQTMTAADGSKTTITTSNDGQNAIIESKTEDGSSGSMVAGEGASWPATAPDYAPAYPGGKLAMAMSGNTGEGSGSFLNFTTPDSPQKVIDFYQEKAKVAGLGNETNVDTQGMRMFAATTPDGRSLSVQVTTENGLSNVALSYASKPG